MKNSCITIFIILFLAFTIQSCEECTVLEMTETTPVNCPELMLNIGDACDDGNPDTANDMVTNMCECMGEVINNCNGALFASRIQAGEGGNAQSWFIDSALKTSGVLSNLNPIEQKVNGFLTPDAPFNTNFAAFDLVNQIYIFAYQYNLGFPNPLYYAETTMFNTQFLEQELIYAAPVFLNGELYAISVQYDHPNASYVIVNIDQNTGTTTVLTSGFIVVNSPFANTSMSSATNHDNQIFFVSGTNLLTFDPSTLSVTFVDIDQAYNPSNQIFYYGLEYKEDENELLAIKGLINNSDKLAQLVSISLDGNYSVGLEFDIQSNLSIENDGEISPIFHSTTFSKCDNTYYISELVELDVDPIESFLIEINLDQNILLERKVDDFIYGLEITEF